MRSGLVTAAGQDPQAVEASLGFERPARRLIQRGLRNEGFDPGSPDGLFGPRTRAAIRGWQEARGEAGTAYLDAVQAELLHGMGSPAAAAPSEVGAASPVAAGAASVGAGAGAAGLEGVFWQSIMNSTNPAEFGAYLAQFPDGVFRALAEARLASLGTPGSDPAAVEALLAGGADIEARVGGSYGRTRTPLHLAGPAAVEALLAGTDPSSQRQWL